MLILTYKCRHFPQKTVKYGLCKCVRSLTLVSDLSVSIYWCDISAVFRNTMYRKSCFAQQFELFL